MPLVTVSTNIPTERIPEDFEIKLSQLISKVLIKPEERITVMLHPGMRMCRAGSQEDTVHISIWSIAVFSKEKNPEFGKPIYSFIQEILGVQFDRMTLAFHELFPDQLPPRP